MTENTAKINEQSDNKDEQALYTHYAKFHQDVLKKSNLQLPDAYKIICVEQSRKEKLDTAENFWITKLRAKIYISKTFLPYFK